MPPGRPPISFDTEASTLGFATVTDMFRELYLEQGFSLSSMERILGIDASVIRAHLVKHGVQIRRRGGPNNLGNRKLATVSDEVIFDGTIGDTAKRLQCSPSTVVVERRFRESRNAAEHAVTGKPPDRSPTHAGKAGEPVVGENTGGGDKDGGVHGFRRLSTLSIEELWREIAQPERRVRDNKLGGNDL